MKSVSRRKSELYTYLDELTAELMTKNPHLDKEQALWWIEMLWSDFESSYAKQVTRIVVQSTRQIMSVSKSSATAVFYTK